jgi:hypothetical protein
MHKFKTTKIKGKEYVDVNQRLLFFRSDQAYAGWSIESELIDLQPDHCCIKAIIRDPDGRIRATGHAQEDRTSTVINKTSYVENCETSAFGRCLAALGIGIETSIASANEVELAMAQQANLDDLTDRLDLQTNYPNYITVDSVLKSQFEKLVQMLPMSEQSKYQDHTNMTAARYVKGIKFLKGEVDKFAQP